MAFTASEKMKIVKYLGWPANTLNPDAISYSKIVSDRLLIVLPEAEVEVRELLERIKTIDESLVGAVDSSGVKRIDDIEFFSGQEGTKTSELRKERSRVINELAMLLDIKNINGGGMMGNICV